jgi:hypothetical protein
VRRGSLLLILMFAASAVAKKGNLKLPTEEHRKKTGEFVYIHKKHINKKKVKEKFPHAQVVTTEDRLHAKRKGVLSLKTQRGFFARTGLAKYVKKYDQLAKDLIVIRLQSRSLPQLQKMYKKVPKATLVNAKRRLPRYLKRDAEVSL